jgi:hypothetical protein
LEAGVYGDRLDAWFGRHQIVLDFGAISADEGWLATARVRIPVTAALDAVDSLQECTRAYELEFGEFYRPRRRGEE